MYKRYFKSSILLLSLLLSGCAGSLSNLASKAICENKSCKEGAEYSVQDDGYIKTSTFETDALKNVANGTYFVDMEYFRYKHPVSGVWEPIPKFFAGDEDEELSLFVLIATYERPEDLPIIVELFKRPLILNANLDANQHNWFDEGFDLSHLPEGANAQYWLGFNGDAIPSLKDNLGLGSFKGKGKSVRNHKRLWPLQIKNGSFVYMKAIIIEETGHSRLRDIWESAGGDTDLDIELAIELIGDATKQDYLAVAKTIASAAISGAIEHKIEQDNLVDLEYAYESDPTKPSTTIPLIHKRLWLSNPEEKTSLEFKLKISKDRNTPIGEKPSSTSEITREINN